MLQDFIVAMPYALRLPTAALNPLLSIFYPDRPQMIKVDTATRSKNIGNRIRKLSESIGNEILVDFITDAIKRGGNHAEQTQHLRVVFEPKGLVGPVKENPHNAIGDKMENLVTEFK